MPRSKLNYDFDIHVDPSCLSTPMDEEIPSATSDVDTSEAPQQTQDAPDTNDPWGAKAHLSADDEGIDTPISTESSDQKSDVEMTKDTERETEARGLQASIETDDEDDEEAGGHSMLSERTDLSFQPDDGEQSYVESHVSDPTPRVGDGDESSSQQGGTDEDVFTDKSPRSSMGSYDAGSESGKGVDIDNMTTITRSPRISDISQYDKEEFIPTARGTPRPPFRTPSDVRAMQMSSPTASVMGSPRSSKKHFPTVSRLGTPSGSAQYSPKRKSTPPRFKTRLEAPLVLLHVTLLPLRWMWGDLVNNLDPDEMSDQAKTLRNSWRILQDRVGDTVIERGILLGHPQNDYEVLEERLLEALDLPVRRRARILECGHYLGPSNETTIAEDEESEDDYGKPQPQFSSKRHWCATCKSEIRYDPLGRDKIFRVKVYASNGLMRAGAWEACWKEMERVDVELEPIVEPAVQDEIVRLAAAQQEREIAQQEEAEIAKEVAMEYEEQRLSEELRKAQEQLRPSPSPSPSPEPEPEAVPEAAHETRQESRSPRRRHRDEERFRETYGQSPRPESHAREPSPHPDPYAHSPPPRSPERPPVGEQGQTKQRENHRAGYQSASLPELLLRSVRVLMQDRKNVIIFTLSLFVLLLSLRSTPPEPHYEPIVHRLKIMPEVQRLPVVNQEYQRPTEDHALESIVATSSFEAAQDQPSQSGPIYHEVSQSQSSQSSWENTQYQEGDSIEESSVISSASESASQPAQETLASSTIYGPCESPVDFSSSADFQANPEVTETPSVQESDEEIETVTEKKIVRVIHTVTETETHTQTQTATQLESESATLVETATAVEGDDLEATQTPEPEVSLDVEDATPESQDDTVLSESTLPNDEAAEVDSVPEEEEEVPEAVVEAVVEAVAEAVLEPEEDPVEY
ncbi:hypothetical protein F4678DRAFT_434522 [Xylaria arbuscula]|nr:hypothetical protein F4678DRAFT_434522 [Xylaria arbuscula]